MPKSYKLSSQAQGDLEEILDYIAQDNLAASVRMRKTFKEACLKLAEYRSLGHWREDIASKRIRFWGVHSYQIVYDPETEPLIILRILSGWRDIGNIMDDGWLE